MEYDCHVGTAEGRVMRQVRRAPTEEALRAELEREGLQLVGLERKAGTLPRAPLLELRRRRVVLPQLLLFSQELAALLRAGLPLLQGLQMLVTRQRDPLFKSSRPGLRAGAERCQPEAFGGFGDAFRPSSPPRSGRERTGELEQVLTRFVRLKLVLDARRKILYICPTLLLGLVHHARRHGGLRRSFPDLLRRDGALELPLLTDHAGTAFPAHEHDLIVGGVTRLGHRALVAHASSALALALPTPAPIRRRFHRFAISEYCRSLSTLVGGGLPLVQALEISTQGVGNAWIRARLEPVVPRVREGSSLHGALAEVGVVPELAVDMVEVGEATGALDQMLNNISSFLDEEVETRMTRLLSLIEPILLLVVGGLVAVLLVSVYLPIFSALSRIN
jgi:type IV pilus assembly protein PilC